MKDWEPRRIPLYEGPPWINRSRREFLIAGGATAGIAILALYGFSGFGKNEGGEQPVDKPINNDPSVDLGELDVLAEIKKFETQIGDDTLSTHQVKNYYIPLVAEYFRRQINVPAIGTRRTMSEILNNTFLIRRDFTTQEESEEEFMRALGGKDEDVLSAPPVRILRLDYPNLPVSAEMARAIIATMTMGALAWVDQDKVFLVLSRVNSKETSVRYKGFDDSEREYPIYQFQGLDYQVQCEPPKAVVKLRSVFQHELVHWECECNWQSLPQDVVEAYQRAKNTPLGVDGKTYELPSEYRVLLKSGRTKNFMASFDHAAKQGSTTERGFNEFVTDYLAARMSIIDRLPYTLGYHGKHSPGDFKNFEVVLQNARISNPDLYKFYRSSQLREFLIQVAKGAKNITFANEGEMLEFTTRLFLQDSDFKTYWKYFRPYFYGINTTDYRYYVDPDKFKPDPGIKWDDPMLTVPPTELGCIH